VQFVGEGVLGHKNEEAMGMRVWRGLEVNLNPKSEALGQVWSMTTNAGVATLQLEEDCS
jgi:hypothetical protein